MKLIIRIALYLCLTNTCLYLAGCELYDGTDPPIVEEGPDGVYEHIDPVEQCLGLVDLFCVAAYDCGWDANTGPCRDHYGAMCERNQTAVPTRVLQSARLRLSTYECAENEEWIIWPDRQGVEILDAMLLWPE